MQRITTVAVLVLAACGLMSCDSPTSATSIDVTLTASPDPAIAEPSTGVTYKVTNSDDTTSIYEYTWRTSFTVTIKEEGGKGLDITSLNLGVQMASGGIVIQPSGGESIYYKYTSSAGGNRINANGSASIGFTVWYDLPNDQKEALVTVSLGFEDDDGYSYAESIKVKVAP
jgi:hypothetical protein